MKKKAKVLQRKKGKKIYRRPQVRTEKIKFQGSVQCSKTAYAPGCTELMS